MRTHETLFNQMALGEILCPCGIQCIAVSNSIYPLREEDPGAEEDICTGVVDTFNTFHKTYARYLECIKINVIRFALVIIKSHFEKVMAPPIVIKSLPTGSEDLLMRGSKGFHKSFKFLVTCSSLSFFKKFQLAETYDELTDMLHQNAFSICAYLVKVKKINEKQIPQHAEESYI
jgi:hypothetical protein